MVKKGFGETSKRGAVAWLLQRISAIILFILLILHFITYHFVSKGIITYSDIINKMKSPWFNLIQFLFLITALYHCLNGVWMIVEDYFHSKFYRIFLFGLILTVGIGLFFVGILTILKASQLV